MGTMLQLLLEKTKALGASNMTIDFSHGVTISVGTGYGAVEGKDINGDVEMAADLALDSLKKWGK